MIRVSVLIPTYNRAELLWECLNSLALQTHDSVEIIVYDDGSQDRTEDTINYWRGRLDLVYVKNKYNRGAAAARNSLIDLCKTNLAVWQDSDDISNIYRIEELLNAYKITGSPVIYSDWISNRALSKGEWETRWKERPVYQENKRASCFPTILFEVDKAVEFDVKKKTGEDVRWKSEMKKKYGPAYKLHMCLYYVRFHPDRLGADK